MDNTNVDFLDMQECILLQEIEAKTQELKLLRMKRELQKSLLKAKNSEQRVDQSPYSEPLETDYPNENDSSPMTMSIGKDGLNPCVDSLQKTVSTVQTVANVGKREDLNLRPNGGNQIPNKPKEQSLVSPVGIKNYYVVFNGPYPGIYISWEVAEQAVKGHSGVKHRKFKSYAEAKAAAGIYTTTEQKTPLEIIRDNSRIDPYKTALEKVSNMKIIGKLPAKQQVEFLLEEDDDFNIKVNNGWEDFAYIYSIARRATPIQFQEEHFCTTDKNNLSYINVFPTAEPELAYEAYQFGLLNTIYPGESLEEIKFFPENFKRAVLNFKKKCLQKSQQVFIKFLSTVSFWEEHEEMENFICPYHYVSIGAVKERIYTPSQEMAISVEKKDLKRLAEEKLLNIIERIFTLDDKIHINMATYSMIVTSFSHKGMSQQEKKKMDAFKERIISPLALGRHEESFCERKKKLLTRIGTPYSCRYCPKTKDSGASALVSETSGASTLASGASSKNVVDPPAKNKEELLSN